MLFLGIDIGSTTSKAVVMDENKKIIGMEMIKAGTGTDGPERVINALFLNTQLNWEDIHTTVATGYGRMKFPKANFQVSELTCHALGTHHLLPDVHTIIDIGGQDVKVLNLDTNGNMTNFIMNDKCAAGTGRFLDVMSGILQIDINDMGKYALMAKKPLSISSTCTVFAESEVISRLSNGDDRNEIIAGICESVANRTSALAKRTNIKSAIAISGGVAKNDGVVKYLSIALNEDIKRSEYAQYAGALGAALYGIRKCSR